MPAEESNISCSTVAVTFPFWTFTTYLKAPQFTQKIESLSFLASLWLILPVLGLH